MSNEDYRKPFREEMADVHKAGRKTIYDLEIASAKLINQLNALYAPETFGKNGFVLKCVDERPEMIPLLQAFDKTAAPTQPGLLGIMEDIKGEKARNPAATVYDSARAYHLLRRMVEISGGDPGTTNKLEALKLTFMQDHFEGEDRRRGRMR